MKPKFKLLLLFCIIVVTACKQKHQPASFNMGDPPPSLRVQEWLKGTPVESFEDGKVYVVEFWATWCRPCKAAMPHLSALAHKYKGKVTFLSIDIYEEKTTSLKQIKDFVKDMGNKMDYSVAKEDSNFMAHDWIEASGENSIPIAYVVNAQGIVAWIGHPKDLNEVLPKIINNTWGIKNIKEELSQRRLDKHLGELDSKAGPILAAYLGDYYKLNDLGKPDSSLIIINEMVKKEPRLKYAPVIASFTFLNLLKTNPHKAYEYGKKLIITSEPACHVIISGIRDGSRKLKIPAEIYRLGAEAYQAEIDNAVYPELEDIPGKYQKMAKFYRLAHDEPKATEAEQKAIKLTHS